MLYWTEYNWENEEGEKEELLARLSCREREEYLSHSHKRRQRQWLLGRLATKVLLQRYFQRIGEKVEFSEIEIDYEPLGKPFVKVRGEPLDMAFSLSHSQHRALAALSPDPRPLGADIEVIKARSWKRFKSFMAPQEVRYFSHQSSNLHRDFTLLWTVKEAVLKAMGVGLRKQLSLIAIEFPPELHSHWVPVSIELHQPLEGSYQILSRLDSPFVTTLAKEGKEGEIKERQLTC